MRAVLGAIATEDELREEARIDLMTAPPGAAYPALMAATTADWLAARGVP